MTENQNTTGAELETKLERIRVLLDRFGLDALVLRQTGNFAWATCGGDAHINTASETGVAALLITPAARFVVTNNIESTRLMHEQGLARQGWEALAGPWYEEGGYLTNFTRGLKTGADTPLPGELDLSREIVALRSQLTPEEGERYRELGKACAAGMRQAVEALEPGMSEYEIAGLLAQAVESRGVQAIVNLVATDERVFAYRHPLPTSKTLRNYAMLVLCGRKWGLVCSMTRLVHFGALPAELQQKARAVARVDAEMIAATRPGRAIGDVFRHAQAVYRSVGYAEEWKLHHQGGPAGYAAREFIATPRSTETVLLGGAFAWNPSITGVKSEDTILVGEGSHEIITEMDGWPALEVEVEGRMISRPAILVK